ncbi:MAG: hypothetical protein LBD70_06925, partial [Bifidobacteriaceae bacterium]|nr:hypothetical protein [Bifidobacteriaceae bacterium]
ATVEYLSMAAPTQPGVFGSAARLSASAAAWTLGPALALMIVYGFGGPVLWLLSERRRAAPSDGPAEPGRAEPGQDA